MLAAKLVALSVRFSVYLISRYHLDTKDIEPFSGLLNRIERDRKRQLVALTAERHPMKHVSQVAAESGLLFMNSARPAGNQVKLTTQQQLPFEKPFARGAAVAGLG